MNFFFFNKAATSGAGSAPSEGGHLPYPSQYQGGMPVPYGATPATPYPTYVPPPMPAAYNPYATMPYPAQGMDKNQLNFHCQIIVR